MDRFLGDDWWRGDFRSVRERSTERTAARAASHVIDEFCRRVKANTGFSSFQVPIRRRPGQVPLFILTLFYRHRVAPWKFNGCASSANADWRKACMVEDLERDLSSIAVAQSLFGEDGTEQLMREEREKAWEAQEVKLSDEWVSTIAGNLEGLLARHGSVNLADNVKAVYGDTLGLARDKHVTRAWDRLTEAGLAFPRVKKTRLEYATVQRGA